MNADEKLESDIVNERNVMDKISYKLKQDKHPVKKWFYGHFHYHNQEYIDDVMFIMLDMWRNGNFDIYDLPYEEIEN